MGNALLIILVICGLILLVVLIIIAVRRYEQKRTDELQAAAQGMALSFTKKPGDDLLPSLNRFPLFSQGHSRRAINVMQGQADETNITLFDYRYTIGGGKQQHTHHQTVVVLKSAALNLPDFSLKPQHIFHNIGKVFGYQDIDFDSHPLFSEKYLLRASNEKAIRNLFSPKVLEYFEARPGLSTEAGLDELVFFRASKRAKPEDLPQLLKDSFHVYTLLKKGR